MFLRSAHIRHYKSLDDVEVEFSNPITVIVGPNAVGKSNLVDCLRFVRDAIAFSLQRAVSERGGLSRIGQQSQSHKISIALGFEESFAASSESRPASYAFSLESLTAGTYAVDHEAAAYSTESLREAKFDRGRDGKVSGGDANLKRPVPPDQLLLSASSPFEVLGESIAVFIDSWRYSVLYPNVLRTPSLPGKDSELTEDGANWASVIKRLKQTPAGRSSFDRINEAMTSVIPTFKEVTVQTVGSYLVPLFRFESEGQTSEFDPVQVSDGTLRIFGMLLSLYQVPPPALLVIEEPELNVHPGVLGVLADAIREASETTQIIVTTHSPHFVDRFAPEEIRVATLVNGLTRISPVKASQVEAVKRRLMSLQEFMLAEGLQPADS